MIILAALMVILIGGIIFIAYEKYANRPRPSVSHFAPRPNMDTLGIPREHLLNPEIIPDVPKKQEYYSWKERNVVPGTVFVPRRVVNTARELHGKNKCLLV